MKKTSVANTDLNSPSKRRQRAAFTTGFKPSAVITALSLTLASQVFADSFTVEDGETLDVKQRLESDQTGVIKKGGEIRVTGIDSGVVVVGENATISNSGTISSLADGLFVSNYSNVKITNSGVVGARLYGIILNGPGATVINSGEITADEEDGIASNNDDAIIINSGSIKADGEDSDGIRSIAADAIISNSGSIYADDDGIYSEGADARISNSGSIEADDDDGIDSEGADAVITNSGTIDADSDGIESSGDGARISNRGIIDADYDGIDSNNDDAIISNSGRIEADDDGIESEGADARITNSGTIDSYEAGIYSEGADARITNSGRIETGHGKGIYSEGADARITNSGSIDADNDGIESEGADAVIINSGSIDADNDGIESEGADAVITNSGTIDADADGIKSIDGGSSISNSGSIDADGDGISGTGDNVVINNSGAIDAGENAVTGGQATTLNLLAGSEIIGAIDLDGSDDVDIANIYAGSISATLTFVNTESINLIGPGVKLGDTVVSVDGTAEAARSVTLSSVTSSIHDLIGQRMARSSKPASAQVAASTESSAIPLEQHKPLFWGQVFGTSLDREAEGSARAYEHEHSGINFGYEWAFNQARVGLVGGLVNSDTDGQAASFSTNADHYYVGAYGNHKIQHFNMTASLLAGYGSHDNERLVVDNLKGYERAKSDFDSVFVSPSLTLASAYTVSDKLELRPSASVSYSVAWLEDYSESGTSQSNLSVDERKIQVLTTKLQVAAAYAYAVDNEFEFRVGLNSRYSDDDDTKISIGGKQSKFGNVGDESVTGGFVGARLRASNSGQLALVADIELGGNNDEDYARGNLSLEFTF